jgi:hypothetical protein
MACRNSADGQHEAGPPDKYGHYLCIHCGVPIVFVQQESQSRYPYVIVIGCLALALLYLVLLNFR